MTKYRHPQLRWIQPCSFRWDRRLRRVVHFLQPLPSNARAIHLTVFDAHGLSTSVSQPVFLSPPLAATTAPGQMCFYQSVAQLTRLYITPSSIGELTSLYMLTQLLHLVDDRLTTAAIAATICSATGVAAPDVGTQAEVLLKETSSIVQRLIDSKSLSSAILLLVLRLLLSMSSTTSLLRSLAEEMLAAQLLSQSITAMGELAMSGDLDLNTVKIAGLVVQQTMQSTQCAQADLALEQYQDLIRIQSLAMRHSTSSWCSCNTDVLSPGTTSMTGDANTGILINQTAGGVSVFYSTADLKELLAMSTLGSSNVPNVLDSATAASPTMTNPSAVTAHVLQLGEMQQSCRPLTNVGDTIVSDIVDITFAGSDGNIPGIIHFTLPLNPNGTALAQTDLCPDVPVAASDGTLPRLSDFIVCKFFDNTTHTWSSSGCSTVGLTADQTGVECACSHLTEFALIFDESAARQAQATECANSESYTFLGRLEFAVFACLYTALAFATAVQLGRVLRASGIRRHSLVVCELVLLLMMCIARAVNQWVYYDWYRSMSLSQIAVASGLPYLFIGGVYTLVLAAWTSLYTGARKIERVASKDKRPPTSASGLPRGWVMTAVVANVAIVAAFLGLFGRMASTSNLVMLQMLMRIGATLIVAVLVSLSLAVLWYGYRLQAILHSTGCHPTILTRIRALWLSFVGFFLLSALAELPYIGSAQIGSDADRGLTVMYYFCDWCALVVVWIWLYQPIGVICRSPQTGRSHVKVAWINGILDAGAFSLPVAGNGYLPDNERSVQPQRKVSSESSRSSVSSSPKKESVSSSDSKGSSELNTSSTSRPQLGDPRSNSDGKSPPLNAASPTLHASDSVASASQLILPAQVDPVLKSHHWQIHSAHDRVEPTLVHAHDRMQPHTDSDVSSSLSRSDHRANQIDPTSAGTTTLLSHGEGAPLFRALRPSRIRLASLDGTDQSTSLADSPSAFPGRSPGPTPVSATKVRISLPFMVRVQHRVPAALHRQHVSHSPTARLLPVSSSSTPVSESASDVMPGSPHQRSLQVATAVQEHGMDELPNQPSETVTSRVVDQSNVTPKTRAHSERESSTTQ